VAVAEAVSNVLLVSPNEARDLLLQGYTYVDVRSEPEFAQGRPAVAKELVRAGAFNAVAFKDAMLGDAAAAQVAAGNVVWNVPWQCVDGDRLVNNPDFVRVMQAVFYSAQPLLIGCRSGSRSRAASSALSALGFTQLAQLRHGFEGARDAFGRLIPGWRQSGLDIETGEPAVERSYAGLLARLRSYDAR
jgi:rhodanese-related sulfurtransferase